MISGTPDHGDNLSWTTLSEMSDSHQVNGEHRGGQDYRCSAGVRLRETLATNQIAELTELANGHNLGIMCGLSTLLHSLRHSLTINCGEAVSNRLNIVKI